MMLRIKRNKFVCFSVLGIILLIIIIILGVHFGSQSSSSNTSSQSNQQASNQPNSWNFKFEKLISYKDCKTIDNFLF
jgi:hypothetical protein